MWDRRVLLTVAVGVALFGAGCGRNTGSQRATGENDAKIREMRTKQASAKERETARTELQVGPAGNSTDLEIKRSGSRPSKKGPAEWFTGTVRIDPLIEPRAPARVIGIRVTFEPGARTLWHSHPAGQSLIVTDGCGLVQRWGGPVETIRPGDVVRIPPGVKHWHGATPTTAMMHIAIYEEVEGKSAEWMEEVTDEQYPSSTAPMRTPGHSAGASR